MKNIKQKIALTLCIACIAALLFTVPAFAYDDVCGGEWAKTPIHGWGRSLKDETQRITLSPKYRSIGIVADNFNKRQVMTSMIYQSHDSNATTPTIHIRGLETYGPYGMGGGPLWVTDESKTPEITKNYPSKVFENTLSKGKVTPFITKQFVPVFNNADSTNKPQLVKLARSIRNNEEIQIRVRGMQLFQQTNNSWSHGYLPVFPFVDEELHGKTPGMANIVTRNIVGLRLAIPFSTKQENISDNAIGGLPIYSVPVAIEEGSRQNQANNDIQFIQELRIKYNFLFD